MLYFKICVSYPTKFCAYSMIPLIRVVGCLNMKICVYVILEMSFAARRTWGTLIAILKSRNIENVIWN